MDQSRLTNEVDRNYEAFLLPLDEYQREHSNQFVLLRDTEPQGFYGSEGAALQEGRSRFSDGIYSVQEVTDRPVDLGFYSHAVYPRIA